DREREGHPAAARIRSRADPRRGVLDAPEGRQGRGELSHGNANAERPPSWCAERIDSSDDWLRTREPRSVARVSSNSGCRPRRAYQERGRGAQATVDVDEYLIGCTGGRRTDGIA